MLDLSFIENDVLYFARILGPMLLLKKKVNILKRMVKGFAQARIKQNSADQF